MVLANLYAAWIGIFIGFVTGAGVGLFFHKEDWLEGYGSWRRRLVRLGHISLFGIAFINFAFAVSVSELSAEGPATERPVWWCSRLLILGAVTMPLVCFLSAFKKGFRHFFFIPVASLVFAVGIFIAGVLLR